jgi:hypothetical protein
MSTLAGERRKVVHPVLEREAEREIGGEEEEPMETKVVVEPACKRKDKANEIFSHGAVGGGDREITVHTIRSHRTVTDQEDGSALILRLLVSISLLLRFQKFLSPVRLKILAVELHTLGVRITQFGISIRDI